MTSKTIHVQVESEPSTAPVPADVILSRPAPAGGSFLISRRLPREDWDAAKRAGAEYYSADFLDDMDMFDAEPGWRYSLAALAALIGRGYSLNVRGQTITAVDELRAAFTEEAIDAYHAARQAAAEAAEQARRDAAAAEQARRETKRAEYAAWKAEHLAGLIRSYVELPADLIRHSGWGQVTDFDSEAGGWYTTGDSWYLLNHETLGIIYRCYYGNAVAIYASQDAIDELIVTAWAANIEKIGEMEQARRILNYALLYPDCIGGDVATRTVELLGLDTIVEMAGREVWRMYSSDPHRRVAEHYGIPRAIMAFWPPAANLTYGQKQKFALAARDMIASIVTDEHGVLHAATYYGQYQPLTAEQIALLAEMIQ